MRAFILPLRLALAVFGCVALGKLMPGLVRACPWDEMSQPPAAVETTSVGDEADWNLPGSDSAALSADSILMPIYEEKDLDRWLASDTGSSAKKAAEPSGKVSPIPSPFRSTKVQFTRVPLFPRSYLLGARRVSSQPTGVS